MFVTLKIDCKFICQSLIKNGFMKPTSMKFNSSFIKHSSPSFSSSVPDFQKSCKFLIAGGGTGGITMASKILKMGETSVTIIEPSEVHYYQPYWTLVGGLKKDFNSSVRPMSSVIPKGAEWIKDEVIGFDPESCMVLTKMSDKIKYDYLIVALGMKIAFDKIKGLPDAFGTEGVCSNYSSTTVQKTRQALENFKAGNAIFTQPPNPIKCAGAPQKIAYLAEEYFTKSGKRSKANMVFNTALPVIFSCPKYATALSSIALQKNIEVNYQCNLIEVRPQSKEAVFEEVSEEKASGHKVLKYEMLHVTPYMTSPPALSSSPLSDSSGFMDVDKHTLQSTKYENVFGLGDSANVPTSRTMAAIASQCGVLTENLKLVMKGKSPAKQYGGYTSCPLVTGYNKAILPEFNYDLLPEETLPIDQSKERFIFYLMKLELMPFLYWNFMLKGRWSGPGFLRKLLHFGFSK